MVAASSANFGPTVRVPPYRRSAGDLVVSLPGHDVASRRPTFSPCSSGYSISAMSISATVKAGQLLATIVAPELDHRSAQAEATLRISGRRLQQRKASRELARVTWERDKPGFVPEGMPAAAGTIDEATLRQHEPR